MRTYEYFVCSLPDETDAALADLLDQYGERGWELITVSPVVGTETWPSGSVNKTLSRAFFRRLAIEGRVE